MKFTYYGHSCFALETEGKTLLFDPFISGNPLAKNVQIDLLKPDYILISHAHLDHIQDAEHIAKQSKAKIIASFEIVQYFQNKGLECYGMNVGGKYDLGFITVKMVQAIHSSSFPDGTYGGIAAGFILTQKGNSVYYAGDTGLFSDMELFGKLHNIKWAILPIGDRFTMDAEQAILAAQMIEAPNVIGVHFDTFAGYIDIDHDKTKTLFRNAGINFVLPSIQQEVKLF